MLILKLLIICKLEILKMNRKCKFKILIHYKDKKSVMIKMNKIISQELFAQETKNQ